MIYTLAHLRYRTRKLKVRPGEIMVKKIALESGDLDFLKYVVIRKELLFESFTLRGRECTQQILSR